VFNATFNNISAISWRSVLLVEETTDLSQVTVKLLSHNVAHLALIEIQTHNISGDRQGFHLKPPKFDVYTLLYRQLLFMYQG